MEKFTTKSENNVNIDIESVEISVKPILFNTEMVRAILNGRKTVTRRVVKYDVDAILNSPYHKEHPEVDDKQIISKLCMPPYQPGDILYVRETWHKYKKRVGKGEGCHIAEFYGYRASIANSEDANEPWKPSIHMPKEAARIWLKVKDVRVERLQEISGGDLIKEGIDLFQSNYVRVAFDEFKNLWNSTIKQSYLDRYGWDASPWVWVIEFTKIDKQNI